MSQRINTTPAPPNVVPSAATTHIQGAASEHPPAIQRLPRNERGRDFVIGDLHGCFDELMLLMQHVRFDMTVDRLIAVGDLVDRGPRPRDCLEQLGRPWFFSVRGNHEELVLGKVDLLLRGEGDHLAPDELDIARTAQPFADKIRRLPWLLHVENGIFGDMLVIHAEILPEHLTPVNFDADEPYEQMFKVLQSSDASDSVRDMVNYIADGVLVLDESQKQKLIWSRKIITAFYKQHRNSIESGDFSFMRKESFPQSLKIFCGHNVVPFPMKVGQQYYIDTGAALGYNPQNTANLFSQFGHEFFALSMVDMTSGHSYGCITSAERRHEIVRLERSIYHYEALRF